MATNIGLELMVLDNILTKPTNQNENKQEKFLVTYLLDFQAVFNRLGPSHQTPR